MNCRSDIVLDKKEHLLLRDKKCKRKLGHFVPPRCFWQILIMACSLSAFLAFLSVCVILWQALRSYDFLLKVKATRHRAFAVVWSCDRCKNFFYDLQSKNFRKIRLLKTFDCSLDYAESLRIHRWCQYLTWYHMQNVFFHCRTRTSRFWSMR